MLLSLKSMLSIPTQRSFQNTKSINKNENFPKKRMFGTLIVQRSQKFVWRLPGGSRPASLANNKTHLKFKKP
jgi:hypothetical protein